MTGRVVCNTGPLIALAKIGRLEILSVLYGEVLVPQAVLDEVSAGNQHADEVSMVTECGSLVVCPTSQTWDPLLDQFLGPGEAAAIHLALEVGAAWLLIDELRGRKVAADIYGLKVRGTAGVLVEAKKQGLVQSVRVEVLAMRSYGYWISDKVLMRACQVAGEV